MKTKTYSLISSSIGNVLEWYDFGLFAIFSPLFSKLFFPETDPKAALIATYSIFAVGFFCRPLGALLFGFLGDRKGRAKTLRLSVLMISLPTLLIGCLPIYASAGIVAPILLMLIRIWQGISIGGEYSGNIIYLGEIAPTHSRSLFTSLAASGANIGIMLAMVVGVVMSYVFTDIQMSMWAWRVPYLVSGVICLFVYATRLNLQETSVFTEMKNNNLVASNPIVSAFKNHTYEMLRTLALACMGSTFYYFCFIYLPILLNHDLQFSLSKTVRVETFFIVAMVFLVPLSGLLSDRVGRYKMLVFNALLVACIVIPGYYYFCQDNLSWVLIVLALFTLASSLEQGTTPAVLVENFPASARYTGISFAYNIANGFLGGSIPLVSFWLVSKTKILLAPAIYIVFCALLTLSAAFMLYRQKHK